MIMPTNFEPIEASQGILDSVQRYLRSNFNPRRSYLADQYTRALEASRLRKELGGSLFREIRRKFAVGETLHFLHARGLIHSRLVDFMESTPYKHQSMALELASSKRRNIIIATGTGSGKTEAFLLPIVNSLLNELDNGPLSPGIRAVLVYPMNALAADQLSRIRLALEKYPEITFGRFVGATEQTNASAVRVNAGNPISANERISRDSMLENPPHILITNYSMLERLLLLPKWDALFTGKLRWIVMDEIHSYSGTKGIEISLLLRRLKIRTGASEGVHCIGSSATLGDGSAADNERASEFAQNLFGEIFEPSDIIPPFYDEDIPEELLIDVFSSENLENLENYKLDPKGNFHLFVKNPGGSFICLNSTHPISSPRIRLQFKKWCDDCEIPSRLIELGACRKCGVEYLIAKKVNNDLLPVDEFDASVKYFRLLTIDLQDFPGIDRSIRDEEIDDEDDESMLVILPISTNWFCSRCSAISSTNICSHCSSLLNIEIQDELSIGVNGKLACSRCKSIGERSPFGPIMRPVSGVDALTAVIATALFKYIPADGEKVSSLGLGKKLLAFSDNRQDAAYFAPYLEDTYFDLLRRRIIFEAISRLEQSEIHSSPFTLKAVTATMQKFYVQANQDADESTWPWTWLRGELVSVDSQQSLSGTGLIRIFVPSKKMPNAMGLLFSKGLDEEQSFQILNALIETISYNGAVELPDGVFAGDPIFAPKESAMKIYLSGKRPANSAVSWMSAAARGNKRSSIVERGLGLERIEGNEVLEAIWHALETDEIFVNEGAGLRSLRNSVWRVEALGNTSVKQNWCPTCRRYSWWILPNGKCIQKNCEGISISKNQDEDNHYKYMYLNLPIVGLISKEHTAQWASDMAEEIQGEFIDGKINVLSSSTTFEMGIDIGSVVAVMCRNVPPTPANYVQRAGRAGRRSGDKSLVVTYARKRSHDAQYVNDPAKLIKGKIPVPIVSLENFDLVRRHVYAIALSEFLRIFNLTGETAESFFERTEAKQSSSDVFIEWLSTKPAALKDTIFALGLPADTLQRIGTNSWEWVDLLTIQDSNQRGAWLKSIQDTYISDLESLDAQDKEFQEQLNSDTGSRMQILRQMQQINEVQENLKKRQLIELLANGGILPKYGFPVDVVSLQPSYSSIQSGRGRGIDLSRDLSMALSEYAPGSQVVAGGKILTSTGVKKPAQVNFGSLRWVAMTCERCGWFYHKRSPLSTFDDHELPTSCGNCNVELSRNKRRFFHEPRYGFIAKIDKKSAGSKSRPRKTSTSKTYLSTSSGNEIAWEKKSSILSTSVSRNAKLLTLNNNDFWFCQSCGYAVPIVGRSRIGKSGTLKNHFDPRTESECKSNAPLSRTTFGHEYTTDVLRIYMKITATPDCVCGDIDCQGSLESAGAALVTAAVRVLGVASFDLRSGVNSSRGQSGQRMMLFDTTPGGAGLAQGINERIVEVIREAQKIVATCRDCSEDSSCYSCLRTYSNQWIHEHLTRMGAAAILEELD